MASPSLYRIAPTPRSHLGAFATRSIPTGAIVLVDKTLFTLDAPLQAFLWQRVKNGGSGPTPVEGEEDEDANGFDGDLEDWLEREIQRSLATKNRAEVEHFYTLSNMHPSQPRAYAIFLTNAISLSLSTVGGLFPTLSRFNSSCRPNLSRPLWDPKTRTNTLKAVRDIEEGEELVWPYLGVPFEFDPPERRREELKNVFGFDCACSACLEWSKEDGRALKESEQRLRQLRRLKQLIDGGEEGVFRRMQALAMEEGLWEMGDRLGQEAGRIARGEAREGLGEED